MPHCLPSTPSDQQLLFLLKLSQWRPSSLRGQMGEVFSDLPHGRRRAYSTTCGLRPDIGLLPQRTWSSLGGQIRVSMSESKATSVGALAVSSSKSPDRKHNMRAPPRYGIALLRPTSTNTAEPILQHADSAQILDCYRNGHGRASGARFGSACRNRRRLPWALWQCRHRRVQEGNTTCGLRPDIGLLPQRTSSSLGGQIRVSMSEPKATAVGALALASLLQKKAKQMQQ